MSTTDPRVDAYIAEARPFARPLLEHLRRGFHKGCPKLVETIKWGTPAFEHGGLLGVMSAHKEHVAWALWRGARLDDPEGLLKKVGRTSMTRAKASTKSELPTQKVIADYVRRAAALAAEEGPSPKRSGGAKQPSGKRSTKTRRPPPKTPEDLAVRLAENDDARRFFESLPPSAKRDYVDWITGAKRDATRTKRLNTTIEWLAEGKRRHWKYENC